MKKQRECKPDLKGEKTPRSTVATWQRIFLYLKEACFPPATAFAALTGGGGGGPLRGGGGGGAAMAFTQALARPQRAAEIIKSSYLVQAERERQLGTRARAVSGTATSETGKGKATRWRASFINPRGASPPDQRLETLRSAITCSVHPCVTAPFCPFLGFFPLSPISPCFVLPRSPFVRPSTAF